MKLQTNPIILERGKIKPQTRNSRLEFRDFFAFLHGIPMDSNPSGSRGGIWGLLMTPGGDSGRTFPNIRNGKGEGNGNCARGDEDRGDSGDPKTTPDPKHPGMGRVHPVRGDWVQFWGEITQFGVNWSRLG